MEVMHTPGPWELQRRHNDVFRIISSCATKWDIAQVDNDVNSFRAGKDEYGVSMESIANAKLIAVAPDMITELKDNHEFLLRMYNSFNTYGNAVNLDQIQTDMRDRMAKQLSIIDKATH